MGKANQSHHTAVDALFAICSTTSARCIFARACFCARGPLPSRLYSSVEGPYMHQSVRAGSYGSGGKGNVPRNFCPTHSRSGALPTLDGVPSFPFFPLPAPNPAASCSHVPSMLSASPISVWK